MSGASFSGTGYDRWSYEQSSHIAGTNDSTINKLQHKFWVTRTKLARKLGKDDTDEHINASDAELDAKLDLFTSIHETTRRLQKLLELYQERVCNLAYEENAMGKFLKEHGKLDRTRAGKMMLAVGKSMSYCGQQRLSVRMPLVRLYQEVDTFRLRAIEDTKMTVDAMERARTEYRGALMWMKNVSVELDPDTYKQLEKFRKVQAHVKKGKTRFDTKKVDVLQKVDLLAAARCNMFSHSLILYQDALVNFWKKTAKTMGHVDASFQGYQPYEFSYIKDLAEPSRQLAKNLKKTSSKSSNYEEDEDGDGGTTKDDLLFFNPEYTDEPPEKAKDALETIFLSEEQKKKAEESLNNLLDLGGGAEDDLIDINSQLTETELERLPMMLSAAPSNSDDQDTKGSTFYSSSMEKNDLQLLEDLLGDSRRSQSEGDEEGGFSAKWNAVFGAGNDASMKTVNKQMGIVATTGEVSNNDDEFSSFVSARTVNTEGKESSGNRHKETANFLLPSQLFDLDRSLYSAEPPRSGVHDLLSDFPMTCPAQPMYVQQEASNNSNRQDLHLSDDGCRPQQRSSSIHFSAETDATGISKSDQGDLRGQPCSKSKTDFKKDMSQWFSLFADLDPLANPDAIGKSTNYSDPNSYS